jgi:hypothetical protein
MFGHHHNMRSYLKVEALGRLRNTALECSNNLRCGLCGCCTYHRIINTPKVIALVWDSFMSLMQFSQMSKELVKLSVCFSLTLKLFNRRQQQWLPHRIQCTHGVLGSGRIFKHKCFATCWNIFISWIRIILKIPEESYSLMALDLKLVFIQEVICALICQWDRSFGEEEEGS